MSKYRRAAKIDANQPDIVKALRTIPGVSVEVNHDDILCGYKGQTFWFEIKEPETVSNVTGEVQPSKIKQSQYDLLENWEGHYRIVWKIDQILEDMGMEK